MLPDRSFLGGHFFRFAARRESNNKDTAKQ
jgi:hypothetical protein